MNLREIVTKVGKIKLQTNFQITDEKLDKYIKILFQIINR